MNTKKIKELIDLMNENSLTEIEVEQEGMKVRLIKKAQGAVEQIMMPMAGPRREEFSQQQAEPQKPQRNVKEVKSPMVGTFYLAPSPDADPYVQIGDTVQKGDVICIVEAMKLMNEIKAEFPGKIVEILVGNAQAVEFGQTLFVIEPL